MKNIKWKILSAYTLAEILIVLTIIAILAVFTITSLNMNKFQDDLYTVRANKIIEVFNTASSNIMQDPNICPEGSLLIDKEGGKDYGMVSLTGENHIVQSARVMDYYNQYIKFSSHAANSNTATFSDGATVSINVLGSIKQCDNENDDYLKKLTTKIQGRYCWAVIKIDVNGSEGPGKPGKDQYILGIGESGIEI